MSGPDWDFKAIYAATRQEYAQKADRKLPKADSSSFSMKEIGDGLVNHVHLIKDGESSVVMKHAPPFLKVAGPRVPLDVTRMRSEFSSLALFHAKCPNSTPLPLYYSPTQHTVLMEDLSAYEVLRAQLIGGTVSKEAIAQFTRNLACIQIATHKNTLTKADFNKLKEAHKNEGMFGLSEQFFFTLPFKRDPANNLVLPPVAEEAEKRVYDQTAFLDKLAIIKARFLKDQDCIVHGDLHTGSVMVHQTTAKIIDHEFSHVGPLAYDIACFVAHLVISYHHHAMATDNPSAQKKVAQDVKGVIMDTIKTYLGELSSKLSGFTKEFQADFMTQFAGFAGCELLRRVLGAAHVADIMQHEAMELQVMKRGVSLLERHAEVTTPQQFMAIAVE